MVSNGVVAGRVIAGASAIGFVWISWGYGVHMKRMDAANAYERGIASRIKWDHEKYPLACFDTGHPNNRQWAQSLTSEEKDQVLARLAKEKSSEI